MWSRSDPPDEFGGSYESECAAGGRYGALKQVMVHRNMQHRLIRRTGHTSLTTWLFIVLALAVTIGVAIVLFRVVPTALVPVSAVPSDAIDAFSPVGPGVHARIVAGDVQVERRLPALSLALGPGQVLDPRLPAGPFSAEIVVRFNPGRVRRARLGAEIEGATLSIERRGKVLVTVGDDAAGPVMMDEPVFLPGREVTFTYRLRREGNGPVRLKALWRPDDASTDLPLPSDGGGLLAGSSAEAGYALVQRLNCVACHRSTDPALQARLAVTPAPLLGKVGMRVRPGWLRRWLADPAGVKSGVAMPALFRGMADAADNIEDLTHFLVSLGGPIAEDIEPPAAALADTGSIFYHRVGCVACHGPLNAGAPTHDQALAAGDRTPLGPLGQKTTVDALAAFLRDPVQVRPSGRMPSMGLTDLEALAVSAFLIRHDRASSGTPDPSTFTPATPDSTRVQRGRTLFAARGCANCHEMGEDAQPVDSTIQAPALERLGAAPGGCLAADPPPGVPAFGLDAGDRAVIGAFLQTLGSWRTTNAPILDLAAAIERFNCTRCHDYHGVGGVPTALDGYFVTDTEVDAGDEGRLPPPLGGIGARLTPLWLNTVLCEAGVARPYMATRMPQFGEANVGRLAPLFAAAAGASVPAGARDDGPSVDDQVAEIGRGLTGATGFNCIQCHSIAGRASTNLPGPDLVDMPERLRYGFFSQWMHDPRQLRPGTRMPTFFYGGRSGLPELGGNADDQIAAIWGYLSQGDHLALPEGLADPGDFQIEVLDEPIVLRTFMKDTGGRAIACGFPERVHFAFDAGRCRVQQVWTGRFLNAAGSWAARGGSETDPDQAPVWVNPGTDVITLTASIGHMTPRRFRGYRFDTNRRPTFHYELIAPGAVVHVRESPVPVWTDGRPSLQRRFELDGPPGHRFVVHAAGHRFLDTGEAADEPVGRTLDGNGTARFTLELTW